MSIYPPTGTLEIKNATLKIPVVDLQYTSNTAKLEANSNVVTEFSRSKKLIKYPRVAMTGQTTSNYTVTGSNWFNNPATGGSGNQYNPWKAFDNVGNHPTGALSWYSFDYSAPEAYSGSGYAFNPSHGGTATPDLFTGAVQGEWLKIQLPHKVALDHYVMYGPDQEREFPRDWTVYGSVDGTSWVRVDSRVSQIFGVGTGSTGTATGKKKEFQFDTPTNEYLYFAFVFTRGSVNRDNYIGIGEIELFGIPEYDPEAHGTDVTVKSYPNVPNTDWLEVYYDAKGLADNSTTVNDLKPVGTPNNGTVGGNTSVTDGAFTFDGSGDYISGSVSSTFTGNQTYTFSMWIKPNSHPSAFIGVFSIGTDSQNDSIGLFLNSGNIVHLTYNNNLETTTYAPIGKWVHITGTYDGTGRTVFMNGELVGTDSYSSLTLTGTAFKLGSNLTGGQNFNGSIANFRLFNRALSSDEIYQLYAYQKEDFGHSTNNMTLKAGRLGIGTSEPRAALDVRGIAQFKNVFFFARATTDPSMDSTNQNTLIDDVQRSNGGLSLSSSGRGVTVASSDASGVYMVYCQVSVRTQSSSERERSQWARLRKNGAWFAQSNHAIDHISSSTYTQHILSGLIDLDAGDEVTHFIDDEGTGIDVYKNATHFYMYRIST